MYKKWSSEKLSLYFRTSNGMRRFLPTLFLLIIIAVVALPVMADNPTSGTQAVTIPNPIKCADATCLISQVIRYILGIIAILATLMFVWGGVMMLTSAGNADRVKRAKETLGWAAIGIIVILLSWAIIRFVLAGLLNGTQG